MNIRSAVDAYDRNTSSYIVAYLDVLGTKNRMQHKNTIQAENLNILYNLYAYTLELADKDQGIQEYKDIQFRVFSDNIIIARKLSDNEHEREECIISVLKCVSNIVCAAVGDSVGWLVRGGLTIGDFYINDTMVWGPALLRAYELENNIADYPRVIIDTSLIVELYKVYGLKDYILQDHDGMYFLNYMFIWHFAGGLVKNGFDKMKDEARKPDGTYPDRVLQKLCWHMNYINQELDRKNERKDRKFRLSMD